LLPPFFPYVGPPFFSRDRFSQDRVGFLSKGSEIALFLLRRWNLFLLRPSPSLRVDVLFFTMVHLRTGDHQPLFDPDKWVYSPRCSNFRGHFSHPLSALLSLLRAPLLHFSKLFCPENGSTLLPPQGGRFPEECSPWKFLRFTAPFNYRARALPIFLSLY